MLLQTPSINRQMMRMRWAALAAALSSLAWGSLGQSCPGLTIQAATSKRTLTRGKTF